MRSQSQLRNDKYRMMFSHVYFTDIVKIRKRYDIWFSKTETILYNDMIILCMDEYSMM